MQLQKVSGQLSEECSKGGAKKEDKEQKTHPEGKKKKGAKQRAWN